MESALSESQTDRPPDEWRRDLNKAVREFASTAPNLDDMAFAGAAKAMLRDVVQALRLECGTLVEFQDGTQPAKGGRAWHWSIPATSNRSYETPVLQSVIEQLKDERDPVVVHSVADPEHGNRRHADARALLRRTSIRSAAIVTVGEPHRPTCAWGFGTLHEGDVWTESIVDHLQMLGEVVASALQRRRLGRAVSHHRIGTAPFEGSTRVALAGDHSVPSFRGVEEIIGESPALRVALSRMEEVALTESTVLLLGETGTGKELFARAIHARGVRRAGPLVSVNCGALPPTLIESELFGHQRGAFTGAVALRQGRFELAHHGTLFLDEIGDLPPEVQVKLLRVLQEGAFERVGSSHSQSVDVRIIAATHCDLARAVTEGAFRADLYYRLNVFPIRLPPLRERRDDIPALVWSIIRKRQRAIQRQINEVPPEVMESLKRHWWPGNIRELENVVERALIHSTDGMLTLLDWSPDNGDTQNVESTTLRSVERAHIQEVLRECGWKINGFGNAAERLGLHPNTLRFRMKKLGIVRHEPFRADDGPGRHRSSKPETEPPDRVHGSLPPDRRL
jgi:transcriptional regulator with GAF, ATPase, and Fis domain